MNRSTLDKLISSTGLIIATLLLIAAGGLFYAYNFIHGQVKDQLAAEQIKFPSADSPAFKNLPEADRDAMRQFAGQQLLTGAQAQVFADNYIAVHLKEIGNGKTYAELSSASMSSPNDKALASKVQTIFRGETLRGLLLNAYAFDTMASVALIASAISVAAGLLLLVLALLGFRHAGQTTSKRRK